VISGTSGEQGRNASGPIDRHFAPPRENTEITAGDINRARPVAAGDLGRCPPPG
jgi:hypothetical protein